MEITENDNGEIKVNRNIDELEAIERIAFTRLLTQLSNLYSDIR